jgi:hypothetical protein
LYGLLAWLMENLLVEDETPQPEIIVRKSSSVHSTQERK